MTGSHARDDHVLYEARSPLILRVLILAACIVAGVAVIRFVPEMLAALDVTRIVVSVVILLAVIVGTIETFLSFVRFCEHRIVHRNRWGRTRSHRYSDVIGFRQPSWRRVEISFEDRSSVSIYRSDGNPDEIRSILEQKTGDRLGEGQSP